MTPESSGVTGEYHLLTRESNLAVLLEDCFAKILGKEVKVAIDQNIALQFQAPGIQIRGNNAEGVYGKDDEQLILWKNGAAYYEVVLGETKPRRYKSIASSFGNKVSSPTKSEEEIITWKNAPTASEQFDAEYQHDADIYRLKHLQHYGELLQEYFQKNGRYPFQGKHRIPAYVYIALPEQRKFIKGGPEWEHAMFSPEEFRQELEAGLERAIDLKYDPQKVPVHGPTFYIYQIQGDEFLFTVHVYNETTFSRKLARRYNKVEITNMKSPPRGRWNPESLFQDHNFIKAANKTPYRTGWLDHLETQNR